MRDQLKDKEIIKVVYCMGSGRSGSTLLGIMLSQHPAIVSPGEISNVGRFRKDKRPCSCGNTLSKCSYWKSVMKIWGDLNTHETIDRAIQKGYKIENFKSPLSWFKAITKYPFQKDYFDDYIESKYNFLKAIKTESGKPVVMDISKNPLRALILSRHPNIDLKLIHLVRDGRGVSWSIMKKSNRKQKPFWRAASYWVIINKLSDYVRKKIKNSGLIKYEEIVETPDIAFSKLSGIVDLDLQPVIDSLNSNLAQEESHIMAGNLLRKSKSIKLKLDTGWQENMSRKQLKTFNTWAKRSLKAYNYEL